MDDLHKDISQISSQVKALGKKYIKLIQVSIPDSEQRIKIDAPAMQEKFNEIGEDFLCFVDSYNKIITSLLDKINRNKQGKRGS